MVRSAATTVEDYLQSLSAARRAIIAPVRDMIARNLPKGFVETMNWGMIAYEIPLSRYPETYNGKPLTYAALAAQKNYNAVYLSGIGKGSELRTELQAAFKQIGKKFDAGEACVRFQTLDDIPLAVIGRLIRRTTAAAFIKQYEASRAR